MSNPILLSKVFDLNRLVDRLVVPVQGRNAATVQLSIDSGSIGSTAFTVYKSNIADTIPGAMTSVATVNAAGVSAEIDVSGFAFLVIIPTTASGGAAFGTVTAYAEHVS